jgi:hypothetical protein
MGGGGPRLGGRRKLGRSYLLPDGCEQPAGTPLKPSVARLGRRGVCPYAKLACYEQSRVLDFLVLQTLPELERAGFCGPAVGVNKCFFGPSISRLFYKLSR